MGFKLTKGQEEAVYKGVSWYYIHSAKKPIFVVGGLAGTGKSSSVKKVCEAIGILPKNILYCALTGKVVSVLRQKGHTANTIHKIFYNAKVIKDKVYFNLKHNIPPNIELIVIDELGMITDEMVDDILSFGVPTIGLGDPKQVGPVFGENKYIQEKNLDIFLTKVMRTDDSSGILDIAKYYREKNIPDFGVYGRSRVLKDKKDLKDYSEYDMVICWKNKTRRNLNQIIRKDMGYEGVYPKKGERVYFRQNNYNQKIVYEGIDIYVANGLECKMLEDSEVIDDDIIRIKCKPTFIPDYEDIYFEIDCCKMVFDSYLYEKQIDLDYIIMKYKDHEVDMIFMDFAWAVTTHASQGSGWGNILVIDECYRGRGEYYNICYTSVTRGEVSVDVLRDQQKIK